MTRLAWAACLLSAATTASAQTPADGWSGHVQCVLAARGIGYQDDQTHTWVLSGAPTPRNDFRDYPATWTVTGRGTRAPISARASAAGAGDSWTHSGSDPSASITVFVPVGTTTIRISAGQRAVKNATGIKGTSASVAFTGEANEWRFQYIDVANGVSQTSLSGSRTQTRSDAIGWRPPPGTTVTETCTWNLTKSGGAAGSGISGGASTTSSAPAGSSAKGGAVGGAAGAGRSTAGAGSKGGATSGGAAPVSSADVMRQYAAVGRTPTAGTGVVFATLLDNAGSPLIGVPLTDIHLVNGTSQPVGTGPYVFGAVGDIVDNSTLNVTFAFGGSSRVAFLDVPVGSSVLSVSTFVAGSVQTRSVQVTTTAGSATVVQLSGGGNATGSSSGTTGGARTGGSTVSKLNPDVQRQYTAIGRTPTPGTGVVFATLVDNAGAPLTGVPLADVRLLDATSQPVVALGPFVFGAAGDIVNSTILSVTSSFDGHSRVAFLDVPVGKFALRVSFSSGGKVVTRTAQVVTTAGGITLAQP